MRGAAALLALALAAACGEKPAEPAEALSQEDVRFQEEVRAASVKARAQLPFFWQSLAEAQADPDNTGNYGFMLRLELPRRDGRAGKEAVWLDAVARDGRAVSGYVASQPQHLGALKRGDRVEAREDDIIDWAFVRGRGLLGHYTTRVELPRMDPERAADLRAVLAENPE